MKTILAIAGTIILINVIYIVRIIREVRKK